ncbi:hypothetical protein ZWY2020_025678 [Hordeum vulgare]|nr:hypothetical protein ZWY2020_025678 [Hordeum vulgare]
MLIHLDVVKDFTPTSPGHEECSAWPRTYRFKGKWLFGMKDGEGRATSASACSNRFADRQSDDEEGDVGGSSSRRQRGSRGGVRKRFFRTMHEQAMCRDTASREPEPRRHCRHRVVDTAGVASGVQQEQSAREGRGLVVSHVTPAQGKRKLVQQELRTADGCSMRGCCLTTRRKGRRPIVWIDASAMRIRSSRCECCRASRRACIWPLVGQMSRVASRDRATSRVRKIRFAMTLW